MLFYTCNVMLTCALTIGVVPLDIFSGTTAISPDDVLPGQRPCELLPSIGVRRRGR